MLDRNATMFFKWLPQNKKLERICLLAYTDFKKRYYGSSLGIIWALINPIVQLLIFYYVFSVFFETRIQNFPLYIFLGLIVWMFFAESTKKGLRLIHDKRYLIENIRIKTLDIFSASLLSNTYALIFNLSVFFLISIFFNIAYGWNAVYSILLLFNLLILVYGLKLILSVIFIYLRDFEHFWDIFLLAAFWANPIVYSDQVLYENEWVLYLNPIAGILINLHKSLLYNQIIDFNLLSLNLLFSVVILAIALWIFKKQSKKLVEIL